MAENIFALLAKATKLLKAIGEDPKPMQDEVYKSKSYKEACEIIKKYVDLEEEELFADEEESDDSE